MSDDRNRHPCTLTIIVTWALFFFLLICGWYALFGQEPTPDPTETATRRQARARSESALARLLFQPHLEMLYQWGGGGGGALREITNDLPEGTDGFRFTERPIKAPGVFWLVLRMEPAGDVGAGWTRVFCLDEKERRHIEGFCQCQKCQPSPPTPEEGTLDTEIKFEPMISYLERKADEVADLWFKDAVLRYAAEHAENERRRQTPEPAVDDVSDAILRGKTRLYRIPHSDFDLKHLKRTLLVW